MTTKIYSRLDPSKLLHMIVRQVPDGRTNLCEPEEYLQCAVLRLPKGTRFKAHMHIPKKVEEVIPQESWCILSGSAKVFMFDTDGTLLTTEIINEGQLSFSFSGGHSYEIMTDNSCVAEYKVGPYLGVEADKIFIDEN